MDFLIKTGYIIASIIIGLFCYYWSSSFKKIGILSTHQLNKGDLKGQKPVNEFEVKIINYFGTITFLIIGTIIWLLLGITIGKIASDITGHKILKWVVYVLMYFLCLRFPFGVGNKMVKRSYDFKRFQEKILFSFVMITSYIISICCFEKLPAILKWHLKYLPV